MPKITEQRWNWNPCRRTLPEDAQRCSPARHVSARGREWSDCSCSRPRGGVRRAVAHLAARQSVRRTALHLPPAPAAPPTFLPGPQRGSGTRRRPSPPAALPESPCRRVAAAPPPRKLQMPPPGTAGNKRQAWASALPSPGVFLELPAYGIKLLLERSKLASPTSGSSCG